MSIRYSRTPRFMPLSHPNSQPSGPNIFNFISLYKAKENFPFILNFSPYFQNRIGNGTMANDKKANKLVAQSTPMFTYIYVANNGNPAAINALAQAIAANAEFAFNKYVSTT